jgi:hypothetical protein
MPGVPVRVDRPASDDKGTDSGSNNEGGSSKGKGGDDGRKPPHPDPIIQGLLSRLPHAGSVWPDAERKLWLELLSGSFRLIYKDSKEEERNA